MLLRQDAAFNTSNSESAVPDVKPPAKGPDPTAATLVKWKREAYNAQRRLVYHQSKRDTPEISVLAREAQRLYATLQEHVKPNGVIKNLPSSVPQLFSVQCIEWLCQKADTPLHWAFFQKNCLTTPHIRTKKIVEAAERGLPMESQRTRQAVVAFLLMLENMSERADCPVKLVMTLGKKVASRKIADFEAQMGYGLSAHRRVELAQQAQTGYSAQLSRILDCENPFSPDPRHPVGIQWDSFFRARKVTMATDPTRSRVVIAGTVSAVKILKNLPLPDPVAAGELLNPPPASWDAIIIDALIVSNGFFIDLFLSKVVQPTKKNIFGIDDFLSPEQIRQRLDSHQYADQRPEYANRTMANFHMVDYLPIEGKKLGEMALGLLSVIGQPMVFRYLNNGYTASLPGDNPVQLFVWNLRWMAARNPAAVGAFLQAADRDRRYLPNIEELLSPGQDLTTRLGQAVLHVLPSIGELHQKINPVADIGKSAWRSILLEPLQRAALQKKLGKTPSLREITNLLEGINAGWLAIRQANPKYREALTKQRTFDAAALLYFLDHALPLALLSYDCMFKPGMQVETHTSVLSMKWVNAIIRRRRNYDKAYAMLLSLRHHIGNNFPSIAHVLYTNANAHDEAAIEAMIGRITPIAETATSPAEATSKIFTAAYTKSTTLAKEATGAFSRTTRQSNWTRNIKALGQHAASLLARLIQAICNRECAKPKLESRSPRGKKFAYLWSAPELQTLSSSTKTDTLYSAAEIGAPCYTFETEKPPEKGKYCSRCGRMARNPVHLLCGHMICSNCEEIHGTRCDVLEEYLRQRMRDINGKINEKIRGSRPWTAMHLNEDLYKAIDSSPAEKMEDDDECDISNVLPPPNIRAIMMY